MGQENLRANRPSNHKNFKPKRPAQDSRTKFDRWLDERAEKRTSVKFLFDVDPLGNEGNSVIRDATVLIVDRYNIMLDFGSGLHRWVAKDVIVSCG